MLPYHGQLVQAGAQTQAGCTLEHQPNSARPGSRVRRVRDVRGGRRIHFGGRTGPVGIRPDQPEPRRRRHRAGAELKSKDHCCMCTTLTKVPKRTAGGPTRAVVPAPEGAQLA